VHSVAEDELLKKKEGFLVVDLLPNLYLRSPRVVSVRSLTGVALLILQHEFNGKDLLHLDAVQNVLLDGQFDKDAAAVRLCPNEASIDQLNP